MKKAKYHYELAAIGGNTRARFYLSLFEFEARSMERALKHYMIALSFGCTASLQMINRLYSKGSVSKDEYEKALRTYQAYLDEIKSGQRDEAAAFSDDYKYY